MNLSVVVCTHNPREAPFARAIDALSRQSVSLDAWELLVIDNASAPALADRLNLSWHPRARILREERLGLTPARLRGIAESAGDLIVFVDDDNVLAEDYLAQCLHIAERYPFLGAWGAGEITPEFEVEPSEELRPYTRMLVWRKPAGDLWSNFRQQNDGTPVGAGMCVRREVAQTYARLVSDDGRRSIMDRRGQELTSAGDIDLALVACDAGLGNGVFDCLKLRHLLSAARVQEAYLLRLGEALSYSKVLLETIRNPESITRQSAARLWFRRRFLPLVKVMLSSRGFEQRLGRVWVRGKYRAMRMLMEKAAAA